ncbi:TetR/AcrR family transcriptional regulator [Kitasatospora sp. NPDC058965]|uniref:TetR/AcrR family transcriptional regulator n=1 Tax=Kitasatospora sp. NPDC058965 TaxID=3346682 RepID=UPI003681B961
MSQPAQRPLRADAERSVRTILEAAEQVLAQDPGASMEQIAEASGLARTTVHRRFASRQALIDALAVSAVRQLAAAVEESHPDTAPPLVVMHRATANVLRLKNAWRFALSLHTEDDGSEAGVVWQQLAERCTQLLERARAAGLIDAGADLDWVRRCYYALLGEAAHGRPDEVEDPELLAAKVVDALLHGVAPRAT